MTMMRALRVREHGEPLDVLRLEEVVGAEQHPVTHLGAAHVQLMLQLAGCRRGRLAAQHLEL